MAEKVSTMEVRARIGDMLNRVALRHDEFIIERKGHPMAALVPVERLEQLRHFARQQALHFLERQESKVTGPPTDEEAMEVALAAQHAARRRLRKGKSEAKRSKKK
jgi:prevent-host-death family protein